MVVDRGHPEDPPAVGKLEPADLEDDGEGLQDEDPPDDGQEDLLLRQDGEGAQGTAQGEGAHVPHEDLGGIGVVPEEADAGADDRPAEDGKLSGSRHVGDLEVGGDLDVPGEVGEQEIGHETGDRRTDGEAVQAVGEIDGVRGAHDDERRQEHVPPSQVRQDGLEKGDRHIGIESRLDEEDDADEQRDCDLRGQPDLSRHPPAVLLGELPVVVEKADEAESEHHHDDEPDVADGQIGPEERGDRDGEDDQDAAHRRCPLFGEMGIRSVLADGLADLERLELADQPGADDETDDERGDRRIDRPKGDVPKDIEE